MKVRYIALLLACAPLLAHAGDEDGHWYINPYGGGIVPDNKWDTHSTFVGGLALGKNLTPAWSTELDLNTANPGDKGGTGSTRLSAASLDVLRVFNRGNQFAPYISFGLGAMKPDIPHVSDSTEFMGQAGVGAFIKMWENADDSNSFSLRPEIKVRSDRFTESGSRTDLLYVLGFTFSFGKGQPVPMAAATAPPPPPPAPPPAPAPVVKCPGVAPGVAVDRDGCPIADVILKGVNFQTNSAVLTGDSKPILNDAARGLMEHHRLRVEIQGHTDSTGSKAYNMGLSQRRADSVRDYLVSQGVPAAQLEAKGYGETQPVASNATVEGRASNRRVVMHVLANPGDVPVVGAGTAEQ